MARYFVSLVFALLCAVASSKTVQPGIKVRIDAMTPHSFALFNVSDKEDIEREGFWHATPAGHTAK